MRKDRSRSPDPKANQKMATAKVLSLFLLLEFGVRWWTRPYTGPFLEFVLEHRLLAFFLISSFFIVVPVVYAQHSLKGGAARFGLTLKKWTREMSWVLAIVALVEIGSFALMRWGRLTAIFGDPGLRWLFPLWAAEQLIFGFNQELMYRGVLQSELNNWMSQGRSLLIASVVFTLGPIHWDQLHIYPLTAGVFGMSLVSGWLFNRYRNIVLPGLFHGIANSFMLGIAYTLRSKV